MKKSFLSGFILFVLIFVTLCGCSKQSFFSNVQTKTVYFGKNTLLIIEEKASSFYLCIKKEYEKFTEWVKKEFKNLETLISLYKDKVMDEKLNKFESELYFSQNYLEILLFNCVEEGITFLETQEENNSLSIIVTKYYSPIHYFIHKNYYYTYFKENNKIYIFISSPDFKNKVILLVNPKYIDPLYLKKYEFTGTLHKSWDKIVLYSKIEGFDGDLYLIKKVPRFSVFDYILFGFIFILFIVMLLIINRYYTLSLNYTIKSGEKEKLKTDIKKAENQVHTSNEIPIEENKIIEIESSEKADQKDGKKQEKIIKNREKAQQKKILIETRKKEKQLKKELKKSKGNKTKNSDEKIAAKSKKAELKKEIPLEKMANIDNSLQKEPVNKPLSNSLDFDNEFAKMEKEILDL